MKEIRIGYFLEDVAHENFVKALAKKVASEHGLTGRHQDLCVSGGSTIIGRFRAYMNDWADNRPPSLEFDLLVIARDCNREGCAERRKQFAELMHERGYPPDCVCFALADPNIERWYLTDPRALTRAIGGSIEPRPLPYVPCSEDKGYYKGKLREALMENGASFELGGAEYGRDIACHLNLDSLPDGSDDNLRDFVACLRRVAGILSRSS